jgi:hypothetical protein
VICGITVTPHLIGFYANQLRRSILNRSQLKGTTVLPHLIIVASLRAALSCLFCFAKEVAPSGVRRDWSCVSVGRYGAT